MKKWIGAAGLSALVFSLMWAMPAVYGAVVPEGLSVGGQQLGGPFGAAEIRYRPLPGAVRGL